MDHDPSIFRVSSIHGSCYVLSNQFKPPKDHLSNRLELDDDQLIQLMQVNLIIPCMGISFLTVLVFYLPSDSGEKVF